MTNIGKNMTGEEYRRRLANLAQDILANVQRLTDENDVPAEPEDDSYANLMAALQEAEEASYGMVDYISEGRTLS